MNQNAVENAFKNVIESTMMKQEKEQDKTLIYQHGYKERLKRMIVIKNSFYKEYNKWQWPVFNNDYFLVTPENTQFLDSKYDQYCCL